MARVDRHELASGFAGVREAIATGTRYRLAIGLVFLAFLLGISSWIGRGVLRTVSDISRGVSRFATGDFSVPIPIATEDELGEVARETNLMADSLRRAAEHRDRAEWLGAGLAGLNDELRGELEPADLAGRALGYLCRRIGAVAGTLYIADELGTLRAAGSYAKANGTSSPPKADGKSSPPKADGTSSPPSAASFAPGEGLVGQAALANEIVVLEELPPDYFRVRSGLGEAPPRCLVLVPLVRLEHTAGVLELALFSSCSERVREFLAAMREALVITLEVARSRAALRTALSRTREQADRLASQEEELRVNNRELSEQQEELRQANEELETQRRALSEQNFELEATRERLLQQAEELGRVSSYKSQFLANMSHELRTPLNSMLLLSHLLSENEGQRLTPKQVEYAKTIHGAGKDLLGLINQVLDLAKIEAGREELDVDDVPIEELAESARRLFGPAAQQKGLTLRVEVAAALPVALRTDRQRLERILVNLLGNALKFTEKGEIVLRIARPLANIERSKLTLHASASVAFSVSDTGVGIPAAALERIFAPFEQVDFRTDRRYGGSGLGLAIARESAALLGGMLVVESREGHGSTFTCTLPERLNVSATKSPPAPRAPARARLDSEQTTAHEGYLLVVEDDAVFAEQLVSIIHARRFKALVATRGGEALELAATRRPLGIILDVKLPDIDGWTVMERLRHNPVTRMIPVHFISGVDAPERALALGAVGYLTKPASREELAEAVRTLTRPRAHGSSRVLVVEDSMPAAESVVALLSAAGIESSHVATAAAALAALETGAFGCVVLDLGLPDMDGLGLLETLRSRSDIMAPPIVVHTARALTKQETHRIEAYAEAIVVKGESSTQRLLDEVRLFVQYLRDEAPRAGGSEGLLPDVALDGVKILIADDDMRTVFALSALLRGKGADVLVAETGREALSMLAAHPDVHGVLMDVMMPEMDGYEAIRLLRQESRFTRLPVIALTAKAMKGERERCLEAGASEYLAKPVEPGRLLTTLHGWLHTA